MEQFDQIAGIPALTLGAAWASGINLYAAMAVPGFGGATGSLPRQSGRERESSVHP